MHTYKFYADGLDLEAVVIVVAKDEKKARKLAREALGNAGKNLTPPTRYPSEDLEEVIYCDRGELDIQRR